MAFVIDTLGRGGAERVLVSLANALDPARYRAHVIVTREPGELARELRPEVMVHSLHRRSRRDVGALGRFARIVRAQGICLVHTHSHSAAYFARLSRALYRQRWRHVMHDHHGPVESSLALRALDRLALRGADHYFAVSERLAHYAREWVGVPDERVELLLNAVAVPDAPPALARRTGGAFTIAHVARVTPEKDHAFALAVAARLAASLPDFRWLAIGRHEGAYAGSVMAEAERAGLAERVEFVGERRDVGTLLASAHVGVLTSRWEGLPLSLLEYLAAGLPVVVTDVGECGATVRASGAGVVVAHGDVPAFAAALERFARDPAAAAAAGAAGRAYVRARYSIGAMAARVMAVYDALLAG